MLIFRLLFIISQLKFNFSTCQFCCFEQLDISVFLLSKCLNINDAWTSDHDEILGLPRQYLLTCHLRKSYAVFKGHKTGLCEDHRVILAKVFLDQTFLSVNE